MGKYAAVSSGTAALHLCSIAAGLDNHSISITSPITFVATANAVKYCGSNVDLIDINSETINIDEEKLIKKITETENIKAIFPVHFAGNPFNTKQFTM